MAKRKATRKRIVKKKRVRRKDPPYSIPRGWWKKRWIPALIFLLAGTGIYLMALDYEYVLDDQIVITKNTFTQQGLEGISDIFTTESFQGYFNERRDLVAGARYRPLSIATFAVEYELVGELNSRLSHFINALLYGLTGLLLFRLLSFCFPSSAGKPFYKSIPFWATALFVLHPVHVEVVANIKGRDEILALMGALGAWYFTFRYLDRSKIVWLALSFVSFFLGLLAKENTITFLAVIPIAAWVFTGARLRRISILMIPVIIATLAYLLIRMEVIGYLFSGQPITDLMNNPFVEMDTGEKYATITFILLKYLGLLFFPHPLSHDYYPYAIPIMNWGMPIVLLSLIIYAGLIYLAVRSLVKRSVIGFCAAYYLATLSIVSNIFFPVGTFMNERFIYTSSVAFAIFLPFLLLNFLPKKMPKTGWVKTAGLALLILYCAGFTYKTIDRIPVWQNALTLNTAAVQVSDRSARANLFMGTALFNQARETTDRAEKERLFEEAREYINRALEVHPTYANALKMKAGVAAELYRLHGDTELLLRQFEQILMVRNVGYVMEYLEYLNNQGRYTEELKEFYVRLGYDHFARTGRYPQEALRYINMGLEIDPDDQRLHYAAAQVYRQIGNQQQATYHEERAGDYRPPVPVQ